LETWNVFKGGKGKNAFIETNSLQCSTEFGFLGIVTCAINLVDLMVVCEEKYHK
jgi:hypothetical protein